MFKTVEGFHEVKREACFKSYIFFQQPQQQLLNLLALALIGILRRFGLRCFGIFTGNRRGCGVRVQATRRTWRVSAKDVKTSKLAQGDRICALLSCHECKNPKYTQLNLKMFG